MKPRIPEVAYLPVTFHAAKDHVVAVYTVGTNQTIGIRFQSPEQMLWFFIKIMEKAAVVWPDNELIKEYVDD